MRHQEVDEDAEDVFLMTPPVPVDLDGPDCVRILPVRVRFDAEDQEGVLSAGGLWLAEHHVSHLDHGLPFLDP